VHATSAALPAALSVNVNKTQANEQEYGNQKNDKTD
jgi:hypothetical protein